VATDFSWVNAVDTAPTITTDSQASTLPVTNLASSRYGRIWRTSAATTSFFLATFAAVTSVSVLALAGCTLAATDTVRHRLFAADGVTVLYDSGVIACGVLPQFALHVQLLGASYSAGSWRCDIVAPSRNSLGYFDIARAWAGPMWTPAIGISLPWSESWEDGANVTRSKLSGGVFLGDGPQYRMMDAVLNWMTEADKAQAEDLARIVGTRGQVLFIPVDTGNLPRQAILGRFGKMQPIAQQQKTVPPRYQQNFNFIQDL
jgi:hypothetical protein